MKMGVKIRDPGGGEGKGRGLVILVVLLILVEMTDGSKKNCSYELKSRSLTCDVMALKIRNATFLAAHSRRVKTIRLTCDPDRHEESFLTSNYFGKKNSLQKLEIDFCKFRQIPAGAFEGLTSLTSLRLRLQTRENSVLELQPDAFSGLISLRTLNLTENGIWGIPNGLFCHLNSLNVLNLSQNYIQYIDEFGFSEAEITSCQLPVEVLDLSHNSLSRLPSRSLSQLEKLKTLNLCHNNLNVLSDSSFHRLNHLQKLDLSSNKLVALPTKVFYHTRMLQELYLQNNSLSNLSPKLFQKLEHLLVLNLSRNDIGNEWLNPETFSSLRRLVTLDLSRNRLKHLEPNLLNNLTALQILDLSHNNLLSIEGNSFLSLKNLHILNLSHNKIEVLNENSLWGLSVLGSLSLDHNQLTSLGENVMKNLTSLLDLKLNHNSFHQLPDEGIFPLGNLKSLDLGENQIFHLKNNSLQGMMKSLVALRLAGNKIQKLDKDFFRKIPNLLILNLAKNQIVSLDQGVFNNVKHLKMLRLDSNELEDINGIIATLTELKWLNVSSNKLQWFDYAFIPRGMEWLDISNNNIEDLGNYYKFDANFKLKYLDASKNRIKKISKLSILSSNEKVFLQKNKIKIVEPSTFEGKLNLKEVNLVSNSIKQMQLSSLVIDSSQQRNEDLPKFQLRGNPLLCNCEMEWILKINEMKNLQKYPLVQDLNEIQCKLSNNAKKNVVQVKPSEFLCQYRAHCFALCKCCEFFACDCRMQCPQGCTCFHDATWSNNVIQCSKRGHPTIPPLIPMDATTIYLDGNNFTGNLASQAFIGRKRVKELFLNQSQIESVNNQTFNGLTELLVLHLDGNLIQKLEGFEFGNLTSLEKLFLQNNLISSIHNLTFSSLKSLQVLDLSGNRLISYQVWNVKNLIPSISYLSLSGNPWSCECDFIKNFQEILRKTPESVKCYSQTEEKWSLINDNVTCNSALPITYFEDGIIETQIFVPLLIGVIISALILIFSCSIIIVFRQPLKVWLHSKYGIRLLQSRNGNGGANHDKTYDALVLYSMADKDFVHQAILPPLEHEDPGYKFCLQYRDLPQDSSISDTFYSVSQICEKLILIVSKTFIEVEWPRIKYVMQDIKDLKPITISVGQLTSLDLAAVPDFNSLLKNSCQLHWDENGFWSKLRFYLPDAKLNMYRRNASSDWHYERSPHPFTKTLVNGSVTLQQSSNSPRTLSGGSTSSCSSTTEVVTSLGTPIKNNGTCSNVLTNPMMNVKYNSNLDHTYQTITDSRHNEPIYHTLEPNRQQGLDAMPNYDTLGKLDVMLPNGQFVPATLVRNNASGKLVPLVEIGDTQNMSGANVTQTLGGATVTPIQNRSSKKRATIDDKRYFV